MGYRKHLKSFINSDRQVVMMIRKLESMEAGEDFEVSINSRQQGQVFRQKFYDLRNLLKSMASYPDCTTEYIKLCETSKLVTCKVSDNLMRFVKRASPQSKRAQILDNLFGEGDDSLFEQARADLEAFDAREQELKEIELDKELKKLLADEEEVEDSELPPSAGEDSWLEDEEDEGNEEGGEGDPDILKFL